MDNPYHNILLPFIPYHEKLVARQTANSYAYIYLDSIKSWLLMSDEADRYYNCLRFHLHMVECLQQNKSIYRPGYQPGLHGLKTKSLCSLSMNKLPMLVLPTRHKSTHHTLLPYLAKSALQSITINLQLVDLWFWHIAPGSGDPPISPGCKTDRYGKVNSIVWSEGTSLHLVPECYILLVHYHGN